MKSNYKIFTAVFLSAIMTAAAPLTVCGAEVFSAGESFSDGTGKITAYVTVLPLHEFPDRSKQYLMSAHTAL